MVIELSSHTDSQGTSKYAKGISSERIQPVGYGESKILNRCVNGVRCPDDEHRFNRRTEFKIIAGPETIEIKKEVKTQVDN